MVKNERGQASIELLIIALLFFMVIFGAFDYWTTMIRIQQAEHIKNYYLDRVRLQGMLTDQDRADLENKFDQIGFNITTIDSPPGRVTRSLDIEEGNYPDVWLQITTEFKERPFMLGTFLGKENTLTPEFKGRALSEYVADP